MTTDIFIRTCAKDAKWLRFAIKSIQERVTGYRDLVVVCPHADERRIMGVVLDEARAATVLTVDPFKDDYVGQQHTKLTATMHTDADAICFWDSDTVAAELIDLRALVFDGDRPIIHHVPFAGLTDGSQIWQAVMTRDMGSVPDHEFMRRQPLTYLRSTLLGCTTHIEQLHQMMLNQYMRHVPQRSFTEFNCLGMWAYANERDKYSFRIDEEEAAHWKAIVRQFWSWGGITPKVMEELRQIGLA